MHEYGGPLYLSTVRKQCTDEHAWQGRECMECAVCMVWGKCVGHGGWEQALGMA